MYSRNDPNYSGTSSFNVRNQSGNGGFGRPYSQGTSFAQNSANTRALARAVNQQQPTQQDSHGSWSVSSSVVNENPFSRIQVTSEARRPDLSSIDPRGGSLNQRGSQESEQQYFARWHKNIDLEEAKDEEEPSRFVDVQRASHIDSQAYSIMFQRLFKDKYDAREFIKAAKDLSAVSCESSEDRIYEGTVKKTELKENKNPIECYVEVKFSRDSYHSIAKYVEMYGSQWKIKEKKISFYPMMRENLRDFKDTSRHKEILIGKTAPQKSQKMSSKTQALYENLVEKDKKLNNDQKSAIKNCLLTTNYNLVLGMPGTGKTQVIATLLKILIETGQKVLVTAYTHSAVDNMLKRFLKEFPGDRERILRLGTEDKIDKEIVDLVYKKPPGRRGGEDEDLLESKMIFAVTCLGMGNKVLSKIILGFVLMIYKEGIDFATCIVDEASQIVEPVIIGPLIKTPHFVLFGDHNQLPPLVKSEEAKEGGMGVSLFEKLAVEHINSISYLTIQYRMNQNIMKFSNEIIYESRMTCANEEVKTGQIRLQPKQSTLKWVTDILTPSRNVVFLDLGRVGALYNENSANLNCSLTCFLARELKAHGVKEEEIGIITPLRSDRNDVDTSLKDLEKLNRYTIDTCQGIDKSCIIMNISLDANRIRPLLSSSRRVNVAFTRSKHKLIIIGSFHDLKDMEGIGSFIRKLDRNHQREIFDYKMLQEAGIVRNT